MVVRVVGQDPSVVKRCTCRSCGNILEYTPNDVKSEYQRDYDGGGDTVYTVHCPCGKDVSVSRF